MSDYCIENDGAGRAELAAINSDKAAAKITEQAETIERLRDALTRIATPSAFWVATSDVNPECLARMVYAECVLDGGTAEDAESLATVKAQERGEEKLDILRKRAALGEIK